MVTRIAANSPPPSKRPAASPPDDSPTPAPAQRSRITNGSQFVAGTDGRSVWVRRAKDLVAEHLADIGGAEYASAAERSLIRRIATMSVELETLEAKFAHDGAAKADDLDLYARVTGGLRRCLETLGIKRRVRDITPSLDDIAADIAARRSFDDAEEAASDDADKDDYDEAEAAE